MNGGIDHFDLDARRLDADLLAVMRMLGRMRDDLRAHHAWLHIEAACADLQQARNQLQRGGAPNE